MVDLLQDDTPDVTQGLPSYTRVFPGERQETGAVQVREERDVMEQVAADVEAVSRKVERLKHGDTVTGLSEKMRRRLERKALNMVLDDLREKGVSDQFLQEHMFTIKERIHSFLYDK